LTDRLGNPNAAAPPPAKSTVIVLPQASDSTESGAPAIVTVLGAEALASGGRAVANPGTTKYSQFTARDRDETVAAMNLNGEQNSGGPEANLSGALPQISNVEIKGNVQTKTTENLPGGGSVVLLNPIGGFVDMGTNLIGSQNSDSGFGNGNNVDLYANPNMTIDQAQTATVTGGSGNHVLGTIIGNGTRSAAVTTLAPQSASITPTLQDSWNFNTNGENNPQFSTTVGTQGSPGPAGNPPIAASSTSRFSFTVAGTQGAADGGLATFTGSPQAQTSTRQNNTQNNPKETGVANRAWEGDYGEKTPTFGTSAGTLGTQNAAPMLAAEPARTGENGFASGNTTDDPGSVTRLMARRKAEIADNQATVQGGVTGQKYTFGNSVMGGAGGVVAGASTASFPPPDQNGPPSQAEIQSLNMRLQGRELADNKAVPAPANPSSGNVENLGVQNRAGAAPTVVTNYFATANGEVTNYFNSAPVIAGGPPLETRYYRVDGNTFQNGLAATSAQSFGGGGGGGFGGGGSGRGAGSGADGTSVVTIAGNGSSTVGAGGVAEYSATGDAMRLADAPTRTYPNATSPSPVSVPGDPNGGNLLVSTDEKTFSTVRNLNPVPLDKDQISAGTSAESPQNSLNSLRYYNKGQMAVDSAGGVVASDTAAGGLTVSNFQVYNGILPQNKVVLPEATSPEGLKLNAKGYVNASENQRVAQLKERPEASIDVDVPMATNQWTMTAALAPAPPNPPAAPPAPPAIEDRPVPPAATPPPIPQPETLVSENAVSTFSLNVSGVSFKLAAASLDQGLMPDPGSIRSEEFINTFDYRDPDPAPGVPVAFAWERAQYPFAHNRDMLRFSIKTAAAGRIPGRPLNLVLLLDNSGSMERADRVAIIHEALRVLASQLQPGDKISIVTFARTARLWVDGISGADAAQVLELVAGLTPEGGTNLGEALDLAYATALRHYLANGVNRVVLLTDGAANLGSTDPEVLKQKVQTERNQGIALDCFGIGWEGYNDDLLEILTRNGDGRYGFINTPEEAADGFAAQLAGALHVAASDVKVQVEFNPARVIAYRQIGYAKQQLTKEQFRDNTVHAAQIGAAEAGNGLYTIQVNPQGTGPIGTVRLRYRDPGTSDVHEHDWDLPYNGDAVALEQSSPAMRLAVTASAFSEWLARNPYAGDISPSLLLNYLRGVPEIFGADTRPKQLESMINQAGSITGK
jgi:secreted protein with Ig-like and vWFA domain